MATNPPTTCSQDPRWPYHLWNPFSYSLVWFSILQFVLYNFIVAYIACKARLCDKCQKNATFETYMYIIDDVQNLSWTFMWAHSCVFEGTLFNFLMAKRPMHTSPSTIHCNIYIQNLRLQNQVHINRKNNSIKVHPKHILLLHPDWLRR